MRRFGWVLVLVGCCWPPGRRTCACATSPTTCCPRPARSRRRSWDERSTLAVAGAGHAARRCCSGFAAAVATGLRRRRRPPPACRALRRAVYPLLIASQSVPVVAVAPILVIYLGFGLAPKVLIVALVCFFPITVNTLDGLERVDPEYRRMMRTLDADPLAGVPPRRAALSPCPACSPAAAIAASYSAVAALFAEYAGGSGGLADSMRNGFDTPLVGAAIVAARRSCRWRCSALVTLAERLALPWAPAAGRLPSYTPFAGEPAGAERARMPRRPAEPDLGHASEGMQAMFRRPSPPRCSPRLVAGVRQRRRQRRLRAARQPAPTPVDAAARLVPEPRPRRASTRRWTKGHVRRADGLAVETAAAVRRGRPGQAGRRRPGGPRHLVRAGAVLRPAAGRAGGRRRRARAHGAQLDHRPRRTTASQTSPTCGARRSARTAPKSTAAYLDTVLDHAGLDPESDVNRVDVGFNLVPRAALREGRRGDRRVPEHRGRAARGPRACDPVVFPVDEHGVPRYDELVLIANRDRLGRRRRVPRAPCGGSSRARSGHRVGEGASGRGRST